MNCIICDDKLNKRSLSKCHKKCVKYLIEDIRDIVRTLLRTVSSSLYKRKREELDECKRELMKTMQGDDFIDSVGSVFDVMNMLAKYDKMIEQRRIDHLIIDDSLLIIK